MQTQETPAPPIRENVFDENGATIETREAGAAGETPPPAAEEPKPKFRIGDREFETESEALTFAQSQVSTLETEAQVADAYRQGIRDAMIQPGNSVSGVTPPAPPAPPQIDATKLYEDPQKFLTEFAHKIKTETRQEVDQAQNLRTQSDNIWREFTDRHPALADFRTEMEYFTAGNQTDIRAIVGTKGKQAAYDFIATKMKSQFERYSNAMKPKRELPNKQELIPPGEKGAPVTPKADGKKALSFSEQLKTIRKR